MPVSESLPADLLLVAHGTESPDGTRTTHRLRDAVAAARPDVDVRLCFLDIGSPTLSEALATTDGAADGEPTPVVVVPLLLSTGFHVQTDIPAAVAGRGHVRVARHLGPHDLLTDVLLDRLGPAAPDGEVVLVAAGSRRPEAAAEVAEAAALLAARTGAPVRVSTVGDPLAQLFAERAAATGRPVPVATYLLTEGRFADTVAAAAGDNARVATPLAVHPALVSLVWLRYDASAGSPHG